VTPAAERSPQAAEVVEHHVPAEQAREGPLEERLVVQLDRPVIRDGEDVGIDEARELVGLSTDRLAQDRGRTSPSKRCSSARVSWPSGSEIGLLGARGTFLPL
jgi:hypothetical protein